MTPSARHLLLALPLALASSSLASADTPAADAIPVAAVPAYAVAAPGLAPPGAAPILVPADEPPAVAAPVGIARRSREDQASERSYLAPTALVAPRGTTTVTVQAPLYPMGAVRIDRSFSDRLSLGVGVAGVLADNDVFGAATVHGKLQLARGRRGAVAATLSLVNVPDDDTGDSTSVIAVPGLVGSLCTTDDCRTLISADLQAVPGVDDEYLPVLGGLAIAHGGRRQLVGELHTTEVDGDRVWLGFVGGRFLGRTLAFDAGFGFASVPSSEVAVDDCLDCTFRSTSGPSIVPYPFFAVSSRL